MKGAGKNKQEKRNTEEAEEWNKIIFETLCRAGIKKMLFYWQIKHYTMQKWVVKIKSAAVQIKTEFPRDNRKEE